MARFSGCLTAILILAAFNAPASLVGQEFCIESRVYADEISQPVSHNISLFTPKLVGDFLMSDTADPEPVEIVLYDPHQRLVVLIDPERKVYTELPELKLIQLVDGLRRETMQNERSKFLIQESFDEEMDWADGWVSLRSETILYRFKGKQPEDVSILPPYFDFLDQFTRLNASDPTKFPPFPRMRLNQSIKKLGWIPSDVKIEIAPNSLFSKTIKASSEHVVRKGLTESDRKLLAKAKKSWLQFSPVNLAAYRGLETKSPLRISAEKALGGASNQ